MQEIKCPNCGEVFQVDETVYDKIVKQVRDREFDRELERREELLASKNELEIEKLNARLSAASTEKKLAVNQANSEKERELAEKDILISKLKGEIASKDNENKLKTQALKEQYEEKIKLKDEQIEYYRDFKAKQSTKMVGESLEQHCDYEFNKIRASAFPNAYFEKDNDARSGSKGDFIFRDMDENGTEFISIMFEMKNETDTTSTKKKNEDFFKELDKDRREKN